MNKRVVCEFKLSDLKKLIYWITLKFKEDEFHHQASSTKSDLIGGFFDRWFNRASEFIIFRELLKKKKYDIIIDNFLYGQDTKKNAPDIIGLKDKKNNILVKFALFNNGNWELVSDMPFIEVKTCRQKQKLIAVGDTQMDDKHYYILAESHVREDYLITLFEESVFDKKIFKELSMSNDFIKSDTDKQIISPSILEIKKDLGYFKLIGIFKGNEIKKNCILAGLNNSGIPEKPYYFNSVEKINEINHKCEENIFAGVFSYGVGYVPFSILFNTKESKIVIVRKFKGNAIVKITGEVKLNNELIGDGYYKIIFKKFDRSSKKKEYIGDKSVFDNLAKDVSDELIKKFDKLVKSKR